MKKNLLISIFAGALIGLLSIPVVHNILGISRFYIFFGFFMFFLVGTALATVIGEWIGKKFKVVFEIIKFGITGVLNTFVDFGVLNLLMFVFSVVSGFWYSIFKGISFIVAVINSYFWNKYWTFEAKGGAKPKEAASFFVVSVIGFIINVSTASIVVNYITPMFGASGVVWANVGALMGTILAFTWNFVGYKFFVFKK